MSNRLKPSRYQGDAGLQGALHCALQVVPGTTNGQMGRLSLCGGQYEYEYTYSLVWLNYYQIWLNYI